MDIFGYLWISWDSFWGELPDERDSDELSHTLNFKLDGQIFTLTYSDKRTPGLFTVETTNDNLKLRHPIVSRHLFKV